jgi:hypothetical protein
MPDDMQKSLLQLVDDLVNEHSSYHEVYLKKLGIIAFRCSEALEAKLTDLTQATTSLSAAVSTTMIQSMSDVKGSISELTAAIEKTHKVANRLSLSLVIVTALLVIATLAIAAPALFKCGH